MPATADDCKNKIAEIRKYQEDNFGGGQRGVNPYLWLNENVKPLEDELDNKGPSDDLLKRLNALDFKSAPTGPFKAGANNSTTKVTKTSALGGFKQKAPVQPTIDTTGQPVQPPKGV